MRLAMIQTPWRRVPTCIRSAKAPLHKAHKGRLFLTLLLMLLTTATAGALPSLGTDNPSLQVVVETQNGASGTVSVSYTNTSGTSVTNQDITSGGTITTSSNSTAKSFTLYITPAAGCEIKEFRRARGNDITYIKNQNLSENNGVFTYTGTSTTNPYTYTITFGPKSDYYFVHFDPGLGGEGTMASQAILKGGTANLTPCTFTGLNGMVFDRWTTNLDGTGTSYANGASITLTSAITLYAQWTYNYTVHFDANGGSGTMADQTVNVNSTGNLNANTFTYTGYVFAGWNTKADGSGTTYTDSASFSELNVTSAQITLYAQWRPFYTVHFDGNGATGGTMADQTIFRITTTNLTANAFTRDGYGFTGWNTEADGSGTAYTDQQTVLNLAAPGETITLYAQWQDNKPVVKLSNTIHFDGNGATGGTMANQIVDIFTSANLTTNAFTRMGYDFTGWNTKANGSGTAYSDGQNVSPTADMTLYAQWTINSAIIELGNTASNNGAIINDLDGQPRTVTLQGRTLYKDGDWNTLCLPFGVTIANSPLAGDNVVAMTLNTTTSGLSGTTLTLYFENALETIPAGTPFIIKWATKDAPATDLVNPVFSSVVINSTTHDFTSTDGKVSFKGTYSPITWNEENKSILFVGENNTLYYPKSGAFVNACRAYFELSDGSQAREFVMNFDGENEVNGVKEVKGVNGVKDDSWYTVNGVKLSGKPTKAGLYIHNGKKVIIK